MAAPMKPRRIVAGIEAAVQRQHGRLPDPAGLDHVVFRRARRPDPCAKSRTCCCAATPRRSAVVLALMVSQAFFHNAAGGAEPDVTVVAAPLRRARANPCVMARPRGRKEVPCSNV